MQRQYRTKSGEYLSQQHNSWWVDTVRFSKDSDIQVLMYILITNITLDSLTLICSHNDKQVWNLVIIVTGSCQDKCNQNGDQLLYYDNYSENTLVVCKDDHFDSLVEGIFNIHFISEIHRCVLTNWPASTDWVVSGSGLNSALLSSWESLCAMIIKDLFMGSCISNSTTGLHNPSLPQTKHVCICATAMVSTYLHPQWQLWIKIKWHSVRLSSLHSGI